MNAPIQKFRPPLGPHYWNDGEYVIPYGAFHSDVIDLYPNSYHFVPIIVPFEVTVTDLGAYTANGNVDSVICGLYTYDYKNLNQTIQKITQSSELNDPALPAFIESTANPIVNITPGVYHLCIYTKSNNTFNAKTIDRSGGAYINSVESINDTEPFAYLLYSASISGTTLAETLDSSLFTVIFDINQQFPLAPKEYDKVPYIAMKIKTT